jgi:hypothetical protein
LLYVVAIESLTGVPRRELMRPAFAALFESPEFDKET